MRALIGSCAIFVSLALSPLTSLVSSAAYAGEAVADAAKCSVMKETCLYRVKRAADVSAQTHMPDAIYPDETVCFKAFEAAKSTGVWPQMGPLRAARCTMD